MFTISRERCGDHCAEACIANRVNAKKTNGSNVIRMKWKQIKVKDKNRQNYSGEGKVNAVNAQKLYT